MNKTFKRLLPVVILVLTAAIVWLLFNNQPQSQRRGGGKSAQMTVEVLPLEPKVYQVKLDSFGVVQPRTSSVVVAQASGQIRSIADNFRDGGFFEQGDILVQLDDRDHIADVKIAKASLLDAEQNLAEEKARGEQAQRDWQRLGKSGSPSDLVLRIPQLEAAKARVLSAEAQLQKAELALERTTIRAPYAGRVLAKKVDVGQVVSMNSQLADIYAVDYVEIRLPLTNLDLPLIDLPEEFRNGQESQNQSRVRFYPEGRDDVQWQGRVVRTEGAIDAQSQQQYVVAQIDDPYGVNSQAGAIKIGQYVKAEISGKILSDVMIIPVQSIYQGSYVYVEQEGVVIRKDIALLWKNATDAIVATGLEFGDNLVVTPLGQVSSGTAVAVAGSSNNKGGEKTAKGRSFADLPPHVQERIKARAQEQGISIEEVMAQRRGRGNAGADRAAGDKS